MNHMGSYETAGAWEHLAIFQLRGMSAFIDATDPERRSLAAFANHSCSPNCALKKIVVRGHLRLGLVARRDLRH
eukprot:758276-Rhodomonas_salina.1